MTKRRIRALLLLPTLMLGILPLMAGHFNKTLAHPASFGQARRPAGLDWATLQKRLDGGGIRTLVLDPGHGGHDSGCRGRGSQEKDITLALALKLGEKIKAAYPQIRVIYTRESDVFIPLDDRAELANKQGADLFISIHCNAIPGSSSTHGSETYVMGLHTAQENLEVAKRENEAILLEEDQGRRYDWYDPDSPEAHIFLSMFQHLALEQSIRFAALVEQHLAAHAGRRSRGVKQAGFLVLRKTTMPSVLIEAGFLTNRHENAFLLSAEGQEQVAESIYKAFASYKMAEDGEAPQSNAGEEKDLKEKGTDSTAADCQFKVQLASSPTPLDTGQNPWAEVPHLESAHLDGRYKYFAAGYPDYKAALSGQRDWREKGFQGAFLVAFRDGEAIKLSVAQAECPQ